MKRIENILQSLASSEKAVVIEEFNFNHQHKNELLLFFKPETFFPGNEKASLIMDMVFKKLEAAQVTVSGIARLKGAFIKEQEIMDRHYGFINRMSKKASTLVGADELNKIKELTGIADLSGYSILGGHEFLAKYPSKTIDQLGEYWFSKPSLKVRSGLYVQSFDVDGDAVILVNGFHPAQLAHFQEESHNTVIVLVNTNTHWSVLKNELAGNTFPEKASADSIRGEILKNKEKYGAAKVTANYNFVHLSAGAFEALFEINNFLSAILKDAFKLEETAVSKQLIDKYLTQDKIKQIIANPTKVVEGKNVDLFTITEEIDTPQAIEAMLKF